MNPSSWTDSLPQPWRCSHQLLKPDQVHYCDYISLETLLGLIKPHVKSKKSRDFLHTDELQFVVIHQMFELAFRVHIFSLREVIRLLQQKQYDEVVHTLRRVVQWTKLYAPLIKVMDTMKPADFAAFRQALVPASGAESEAEREIELLSGIRPDHAYSSDFGVDRKFRDTLNRDPEDGPSRPKARWWTPNLEKVATEPNLNEVFTQVVQGAGFTLNALSATSPKLWTIALLLHDYDVAFLAYRAAHLGVVGRQIGKEPGTGHTSGVPYLKSVDNQARFFPEIYRLVKGSGQS